MSKEPTAASQSALGLIVISVIALLTVYVSHLAGNRVQEDTAKDAKVENLEATVVSYAKYVEDMELRRASTRRVVDFIMDHPSRATITASPQGIILQATGDLESLGLTAECTEGRHVENLGLPDGVTGNSEAFVDRRDEGREGQVRGFTDTPMRRRDGSIVNVDGILLWHEERQLFLFVIAVPSHL